MRSLLEQLSRGAVLISDGAMGTLMQAHGLKPGECPEAWNVAHPQFIRSVAQAYLAAGSDIVETNSFGGTRLKLAKYGLGEHVTEYNRAAAALAKAAMGERGYVAASVGPTGEIAEEEGGDSSEQALYAAFQEQVVALADGGADALCIESMFSLIEARQAIRAAKEQTDLPVICTFAFTQGAQGFRTMMGVEPARAAAESLAAGADIIGANCGHSMAGMVEITQQLRASAPDALLMIQPNAGLPVLEDGVTRFRERPEEMAVRVKDLLAAGANIVGGCCGTTPAHIAAIARAAWAASPRRK